MEDNNEKSLFQYSDELRTASENQLMVPYTAQYAGVPGTPSADLPPVPSKTEQIAEQEIQRNVSEGKTIIKSFGDGRFGTEHDYGSAWDRGYQAMQSETGKSMATGWNERNLENVRMQDAIINNKVVPGMESSTDAYTWESEFKSVGNYFKDVGAYIPFVHTWEEAADEENKKKIAVVDPNFNMQRRITELDNFQKKNPQVFDFMRRHGMDPFEVTSQATNIDAFNYMLVDNLQQSVYNANIPHFEDSSLSWLYRGANSFTHNPAMMRDMVVTTALTMGYGTAFRLLGGTVMEAAGAAEATAATRAAIAAKNVLSAAQKITGPMTGLIEGPTFMLARKALLGGAGISGARIATARAVAIATEGALNAGWSSLGEQERQYEWQQLVYKVPDQKFEYNLKETAQTMATAALVSTAMLGFMRFGIGAVLGDIGNIKEGYKTGDWSKFGRSVAHSLDGWATTKEGMIVYGNKLSEGRGVLFGNLLDNSMKKIDNRSSASIMMGGSRLFGQVDAHAAAKMNLDIAEAASAIDKFEKVTGIAGEAAMRGVADADPETAKMFGLMMNKRFLEDNGLSHGSVAQLFSDYEMAMKGQGGVFPAVKDAAGNVLEGAPKETDRVGGLLRLVEAHIVDRNIKEYGLSSADMLNEIETMAGKKPNMANDVDFHNYNEVAIHRVGDKAEQTTLDLLQPLLAKGSSPDAEVRMMGRTIPQDVAKSIMVKALQTDASKTYDKSWVYITNGGGDTDSASFVLAYDPDTGVVSKTGRKLVHDPATGKIKTEFDVHSDLLYQPERRVSMKEIGGRLKEMQAQVDKAWESTMKTKIEKLVKEGKVDAVEATKWADLWAAGKQPTPDEIKKIFALRTKAQAHSVSVIMKVLGYNEGEDVLRIAAAQKGSISDKASANIVFDASKALIQSTKESDIGSIVHEMGHYNRLMFINNEHGLRDRAAIGISEGDWKAFLKWVGNEDNIWTEDAAFNELKVKAEAGDEAAKAKIAQIIKSEEKYTNGFSNYMKSVLKGEGKAPDSAIQRLLHKLGDHLGDINTHFKTQEALEAGLDMTPEAAMVYSKLLERSKDKTVDFFDAAYRNVFSKLPTEQRNAIGNYVLGELMWKDYVAKLQKEKALAKAVTDGPIARSAVPRISKKTLIDNIHAELKGGVSKKLINDALDAGFKLEDIKAKLADYVNVEEALFSADFALIKGEAKKANAVQRNKVVARLRAEPELVKKFEAKKDVDGPLDIIIGYKVEIKDGKFADAFEEVSLDKATREALVKQAAEAPKAKKPSKAAMESGVAAAIAVLETPAKVVDERGVPLDLSSTEKAVVIDEAIKTAEGERNIAKAEEIATKVDETVDLDSLLEISREPESFNNPVPEPEQVVVRTPEEPGVLRADPLYVPPPPTPTPVIMVERLGTIPEFTPVEPIGKPGLLEVQMVAEADAQQARAMARGEVDANDPTLHAMIEAIRRERTVEEQTKAIGETDSTDPELMSLIEQVRQERATIDAQAVESVPPSEGGQVTERPSEAVTAPESILAPDATPEMVTQVEQAVQTVPTLARRKAKPSTEHILTPVEADTVVIVDEVRAESGEVTPPSAPKAVEEPKTEVVAVLEDPSKTTAEKVETLKKVETQLEKADAPPEARQAVSEVRQNLERRPVQEMSFNGQRQMQAAVDINEAFWRSFKEGRISAEELADIKTMLKGVTNDYKKDAFFRWVTDHKNKELKALFYDDPALRRMWSIDVDANSGRMAQMLNAMLGIEAKERSVTAEAPTAPQAMATRRTTLAPTAPATTPVAAPATTALPVPATVRTVSDAGSTKVVEVPQTRESIKEAQAAQEAQAAKADLAAGLPTRTDEVRNEGRAFRVRSTTKKEVRANRARIAEESFRRQMQASTNTLDDLSPESRAVLKKIVAKIRKSGTMEELAEMWKFYLTEEKIEIPKPSHSYIEAELKFVISSEQFAHLKGLSSRELTAFVHIKDEIEANMNLAVMETALRDPTPDNFKMVEAHTGIPAQYMDIYVRAVRHIDAAPEISDFQRAWTYIGEHSGEQADLVKFLEDNKARYDEAVALKKNKEMRTKYEKQLSVRQTYLNAQERVNKGIIPTKDIADLDSDRAVQTGLLWDMEDEESYPRVLEVYMRAASSNSGVNVGINEVLAELTHNTNLQERIAKELRVNGPAEEIVKAYASGAKNYDGQPFTLDGINSASKYLKGVVRRMSMDNDTAGKGTRKNVINVMRTDKEGESIELGVGHNFRLDTDHASDVSKLNESALVTLTVSHLYDKLVAEGKLELADYLAARRATTGFSANREINLVTAYARRATERTGEPVQVTEAFIGRMEKRLAKEMDALADKLTEMGVELQATYAIREGRLNIIDPTKIDYVNAEVRSNAEFQAEIVQELQLKDAAKKETPFFSEAPARRKAKPSIDATVASTLDQAAREVFGERVNTLELMESMRSVRDFDARSVLYDVTFGDIRNCNQLLDSLLGSMDRHNKYYPIKELLEHIRTIPEVETILKKYATAATMDTSQALAYVHPGAQLLVLSHHKYLTVETIAHELIHVVTSRWMDLVGKELTGVFESEISDNPNVLLRYYRRLSQKLNTIEQTPTVKAAKELIDMYIQVRKNMHDRGFRPSHVNKSANKLYGMTNIHEFMAEAVTNPEFHIFLEQCGFTESDVVKATLKYYDAAVLNDVKDPSARAAMGMTLQLMDALSSDPEERLYAFAQNPKHLRRLQKSSMADLPGKPVRVDFLTGEVTSVSDLVSAGMNPLRQSHIRSSKVRAELKARADLSAAKGRVAQALDQLREVALTEDSIASAKAAGAESTAELEARLKKLVDSAEVRRRQLIDLGFEAEVEPDDIKAIRSAMEGHPELVPTGRGALMRSVGARNASARRTLAQAVLQGKSYRSLTDDERRTFVTDVLMPKIDEAIGNRNASAGMFSGASDTKLGKWINGRIGGGASYGDTAESGSKGLQFLSKILDPTMDLRDGELHGAFNLFSMDLINAEKNNAFSRSGMLGLKNKIRQMLKDPATIDKFNDTAWSYLGRLESLPKETPHYDLMVEFIKAVHQHNRQMGETLVEFGNLSKEMVPEEYGTIHRVNEVAYTDRKGFAEALHGNILRKIKASDEINLVTAEALGWVHLKRESGNTDDIVSFTIPKESPLAKIMKADETHEWNAANRAKFGKDSATKLLDKANLDKYRNALVDTKDYTDSWKNLYSNRGPEYTALRRSMEIARDRYLGIDLGDSKTGKPRSESPSNMRNRSESRILSHNEIAADANLSKYFHKEIYDLIYQQLNHDYTDALMTKHISNYFGTKMSWLDLVHILGSYGEETMDKANMSLAEITSRRNGYKRMSDIWEAHTGKMAEGKDGVDKYYASALENSRIPVLIQGGIRASLSSLGEVSRALLASNQHKAPVIQLVDNLKKAIHLAISRGKRDSIKEVASATHWIRGLSADHLLARSDINPSNPFNGLAMGTRNPGFFQRLVSDWRKVGQINKAETNGLTRGLNYVGIAAQRIGAPLGWINDISTTLHIWNAQENFTKNSDAFLKLAESLQGKEYKTLQELERLAARCGLRSKEALSLSTAGLLDPEVIKIIRDAGKDQSLYSDGLMDVQKMYKWAEGDAAKLDAIDRLGGFINMTARQTNAEPTLLDLRVNQSLYAKSMSIFTQFLLTHSAQEIGRRRRYSTTNYGIHLGGLLLMEMLTYSMIRNRDKRGVITQVEEEPVKFALQNIGSMPVYGSYSLAVPLIRAMMTNAYSAAQGEDMPENVRLPDLYGAPAETAHVRAYETVHDMIAK